MVGEVVVCIVGEIQAKRVEGIPRTEIHLGPFVQNSNIEIVEVKFPAQPSYF